MKKITTFLGVFLFAALILSSCGTDAKDINVSDLDTPCDYIDAMLVCAEEMTEIKGDQDYDDLSKDDKKEMDAIRDKFKEIGKAGQKKFDKDEVRDCDGFDKLDDLMDELR